MNIYPTYTVGAIFVVGIVQSILVWLALSSAVSKLGSTAVFKNLARIGLAMFFVAWFGIVFALSESDTLLALTESGGRARHFTKVAFQRQARRASERNHALLRTLPEHGAHPRI